MKTFFIVVLVLNFLFETLAGVALITGPTGLGADSWAADGMWGMNYGFGALAIASMLLWVWPLRTNLAAVSVALGVLITFHVGLTISLAIPGNQMAPMLAHAVMAVLCIVAYTQRRRWAS
ncbi:MAG: hypothetical protein AAF529_04110 [Pseudomonadota bacterium]